MKKSGLLLVICVLTLAAQSVRAQYYSVNVDPQTIAAMSEAFAVESANEAVNNENLQKIADAYKAASIASSGIFAAKYLDRKALTDITPWKNKDENYYYKRIYKLVRNRIIPKTITVASMLMKDPSTAIYWGGYLLKICDDVKSLCQQFESIVTNSSLSFKDIAFLEIKDELAQIFDLQKLGDVDWKVIFDDLSSQVEGAFSSENIKSDLDVLLNKGVGLATAGVNNAIQEISTASIFSDTFEGSLSKVTNVVNTYKDLYDQYKNHTGEKLLSLIGGEAAVENLFNISDYNMTRWITDYASSANGDYYTLEVSIVRSYDELETLYEFHPSQNINVITGSLVGLDTWNSISEKGKAERLALAQDFVLECVSDQSGWSLSKINELNASQSDYVYSIVTTPYINTTDIVEDGTHYVYLSCDVKVIRNGGKKEVVYSEVYDSYSMDWNSFINTIQKRRDIYDDLAGADGTEDAEAHSYAYTLVYGEKHYYQASDEKRLAGTSMVTIKAHCSGGSDIASGSTSYKCSECGSSVSAHTRQCVMATTLTGEQGVDVSSLQTQLTEAENLIVSIKSQLSALQARQSEISNLLKETTSTEEVDALQAEFQSNKSQIASLQQQLSETQQKVNDTNAAIKEANESESVQTDDYHRIPHIMNELQTNFNLSWKDAGSWNGNSFVRTATMGGLDGVITFTADVSIIRKPKYFLGIKIHRAIVGISWKLQGNYSETTILETIKFDNSSDDQSSRSKQVNERLSYWAQQYPECDIKLDYLEETPPEDDTSDVYHLLWASDRLEIARSIMARLANIYTGLVHLEKYLHYKHDIIDWLKDLSAPVNPYQGRRSSTIQRSHRRWMHNSGSKFFKREEENDNSEENDSSQNNV